MQEMIVSQNVMLQRQGIKEASISDGEVAVKMATHLEKVEAWLTAQKNMDVIYISFNDVIKDPLSQAQKVNQFLNNQLDSTKMASVVEKKLYRQKKE